MTHLHAPFSSHLAGNCSAIRTAHYYKRCKKSLFFALKSFKFRFVFCFVSASKPMQKRNIFPVFLENLRNILQANVLGALRTVFATAFNTAETRHNLLTCKILTQYGKKNEKKVQKLMQNFTRFSH
jgi:hypothetical protein